VPSPTGNAVLFVQEEDTAGLYLLRGGSAQLLTPQGPAVRSDYAWSRDGTHFAFSSPGVPGEGETGIYLATLSAPTGFQRLWDRGSHPRFLPGVEGIVCAGPEDGSEYEGIWQLDLTGNQRNRLVASGVSPEVSFDGISIAYLSPGSVEGRTLVVLSRETGRRTTLGTDSTHALNFSWLGDSRTIVFETGYGGAQEIWTVRTEGAWTAAPVVSGTMPAGFPEGTDFVYTGLVSDLTDGLFVAGPGRSGTRICATGVMPQVATMNLIVAQDSSGIIELTR